MLLFPNCKINLGLNITAKRPDGYHDIETVFFPLPLRDALEVVRGGAETKGTGIHFTSTGLPIPGDPAGNLCVKAYHLLAGDHPSLLPVQLHLHKVIPMGAGLGGGSADGAFTLVLLNKYFNLGLTHEQLIHYALQLGSDCPFFIENKPCYATGRGEKMEAIDLTLSEWQFLLVHPDVHVSTGWAFAQLTPQKPVMDIREVVKQPVEKWKEMLVNDFEKPVAQQFPVIASIKQELYKQGAVYASMTGSGSTVYGMFRRNTPLPLDPFSAFAVSTVI